MVAVLGAAAAVWITLRSNFLAYPGWLALQKADFILGPIGVGLYWHHRRPDNRFGLLLILLGLCGVPYVLESSSNPTLFAIGVLAEEPIYVVTTIVILAFPTGRLQGPPEWLVVALLVGTLLLILVINLSASHLAPGLSISECRVTCPQTGLGVLSPRSWHIPNRVIGVMPVLVALATAGVIAWRFATGTPPRRRALAIGTPVALLFLFSEAAYRGLFLFAPNGLSPSARPIQDVLQWSLAATRSFIWYGFLFALIAAELFAAGVLRNLVRRSLGRPSLGELEGMLRGPLGDPGLRLGFWDAGSHEWIGHDGGVLAPPRPGQRLTEIDRDARPAAAVIHDLQLSEDPELLQAAGAAALLAQENAELEAAWKGSLRELADSRARLVQAGDGERRKLERDLHDGAQQRLVSIQLRLRLLEDDGANSALADQLELIRLEAEEAVEELRTLSHGIYPPLLRDSGLGAALRSLAMRAPIQIRLTDDGIGRCPAGVEAAIYFCSLEAVQNAIKHAGRDARVDIVLGRRGDDILFSIVDDGPGMDSSTQATGAGLVGMRDRIGAVGGQLEIISSPGNGLTIKGAVPSTGERR